MAKRSDPKAGDESAIQILLEEYRSLYSIVLFRMSSLERRVPLGAAAIIAVLASVLALNQSAQLAVLVALPIGLYWYLATTINHARSFEDVLRRIDEIERQVNALTGRSLLCFQSTHPSRGKRVGGRTGHESIQAVFASSLLTLLACLWIFTDIATGQSFASIGYPFYVTVIAVVLFARVHRLSRYRYRGLTPAETPPSP